MKFRRIYLSLSVMSICLIHPFAFAIELVSVSSSGVQGNDQSGHPDISADGRFVAFHTAASTIVDEDSNGTSDIFVHDRQTGETQRVSVSSQGEQGNDSSGSFAISADGRFVVFTSYSTNLVSGDSNAVSDVFVHDRDTGLTQRVSVSTTGEQANDYSGYFFPENEVSISADGRFISFVSDATNLVANDTNNLTDIFVHDRNTRITERASVTSTGEQANSLSSNPVLSADGQLVAYVSNSSNIVDADSNNRRDVFTYDRNSKTTQRVSISSSGKQGNYGSYYPAMSSDGRFIAFTSEATNLVDLVGGYRYAFTSNNIFVHDRQTAKTEIISLSSNGEQSNGYSYNPAISDDGRFVFFSSSAQTLVADDINGFTDILVHDRQTRVTELVSLSAENQQGLGFSLSPAISRNGDFIAFSSTAYNLVSGDSNQTRDVFITRNFLPNLDNKLLVTLNPTSVTSKVGEYTPLRARMVNNSNKTLTGCRATIFNPVDGLRRQFSFFSWPLNVSNPAINAGVDIAPGKSAQLQLMVLPRVPLRQEVRFRYTCENAQANTIAFANTLHLTAKATALIAEDFITLTMGNNLTDLKIDRSNEMYWTSFVVKVMNKGTNLARIKLGTATDIVDSSLKTPRLCEPVDPFSGSNWTCSAPGADQVQIDIRPGEAKKIVLFVRALQDIKKRAIANRITVEARDRNDDVVAKHSIGVHTLN